MRIRATRIDVGLERAMSAFETMSAFADALGLTVQSVAQWTRVPVERVLHVEQATGVSRHVLRPDIYGPEPKRRPLGRARKPEPRVAA